MNGSLEKMIERWETLRDKFDVLDSEGRRFDVGEPSVGYIKTPNIGDTLNIGEVKF